jgi:uncharacterized protein (DUF885 family)
MRGAAARRVGLVWLALALACAGDGGGAPPGTKRASGAGKAARSANDARVLAIGDALVAEAFDESPRMVALLRPPGARYDTLPDASLAGVAARAARRARWQGELEGIPRGSLSGADARLAYDLARERLQRLDALRVCKLERWAVSQMSGWHVELADTALAQPVETAEQRAQALARYAALPRYADQDIEALRAGLSEGRTAPRLVVDLVIAQLDALLAAPPEASPFASPALRADDPAFRTAFLALVQSAVRPALQRTRDFLANELAPRARREVGLAALPDGGACYAAMLGFSTTLDLSPQEVHARGETALA